MKTMPRTSMGSLLGAVIVLAAVVWASFNANTMSEAAASATRGGVNCCFLENYPFCPAICTEDTRIWIEVISTASGFWEIIITENLECDDCNYPSKSSKIGPDCPD